MVMDPQPGPSQQIVSDTGVEENITSDTAIKSPTTQDIQLSPICTPKSRRDLTRPLRLLHSVSISRADDLTPKAQKLYRVATNLRNISKQRFKENASVKTRLKKASEFIETEEYVKSTVNRTSFNFIMSQLKQQKVKHKGRRFTLEDKVLALTLYKQGRRAYKLLQRIFALPSSHTLRKLLENVSMHCGINETIIDALKHAVSKLEEGDKY